jgi:hypothetical protein
VKLSKIDAVEEGMSAELGGGIVIGSAEDLFLQQRKEGKLPRVTTSRNPRGLALRSLTVTRGWGGLWGLLNRKKQIYFLSVALDLSGDAPVIMPPKDVPKSAVVEVAKGETIRFTLGDGAPICPPRVIVGGLIVYLLVAEADRGIRHVGETLEKVHADLTKDKSLEKAIKDLVASPGAAAANIALGVVTAALQPIATILKSNEDEYVALFQGCYSARGSWRDKLSATQNGVSIEFACLS